MKLLNGSPIVRSSVKSSTRALCAVLAVAMGTAPLSALAQGSGVSTNRIKKAKTEPIARNPFSGGVDFSVGNDTNALIAKVGAKATFFQIAPNIQYKGEMFRTKIDAAIKDFSDQTVSNNAKENSATANFGIDGWFLGKAKSATDLTFQYSDQRWPNFFASADPDVTGGAGMPVRYMESRIGQSLLWDFKRLSIRAAGSFAYRDYSSQYSDFVTDVLGPVQFQNDRRIANGEVRFGIKMNENFEIGATPSVGQQFFMDRPARETNGQKFGQVGLASGTPTTEYLTNNLKADLAIKTTYFDLNPYVSSGVQMDQATGGEDFSSTGAGLSLSVKANEAYNIKIVAGLDYENQEYDNWRFNIKSGSETRADTHTTTRIALSADFSKNLGASIGYQSLREESTLNDSDENYQQDTFTTTIGLRF
jgi:hypothetical protein